MVKSKFFNLAYFVIAGAVFAWMLRDNPHLRLVPIMSMLLCGFYGLLAVVSLIKPNGFAVTHEVFPANKQRCLRRLALLMPIPALLYFGIYTACMEHAGEFRCLNKYFVPIAKFEKASFSRDRMIMFVLSTQPRLIAAAEKNEQAKNWRAAESYYKAATGLENRIYSKKLPSSYTIMACLYEKMGRHDKAEKMFLKAEQAANEQCCSEERICNHSEVISVPHVLSELKLAKIDAFAMYEQYPWLQEYQGLSEAPASIQGRQFIALAHLGHSHAWCKESKCALNCEDDSKACNDKDCDKEEHHHHHKHSIAPEPMLESCRMGPVETTTYWPIVDSSF